MTKVVIVADAQSYMIITLKEKLAAEGCQVEITKPTPDAVSRVEGTIGAFFLYSDGDLTDNKAALTYIKDKAVEEDIAVFVSGTQMECDEILSAFPKHIYTGKFVRPINVGEVAEKIGEFSRSESVAKKKILVIDDSGAYLRNVKAWLDGKYQVIPANSGMMGIKYMSTNRPDLVLLDYEMPVCDGRQVLEMIRADSDFADIPVIFLTSKDDKDSVIQVMSLKPQGYLLKTLEPAEIIRQVDDFFAKEKAKS